MKVEISSYEQFKELSKKGDVLVDFYATWCGPCKMIAPFIEEIAEENSDLTVLSVDVDEISEAAAEYGVSAIPTLLHLEDGKLLGTNLGYAPKKKILSFIGR